MTEQEWTDLQALAPAIASGIWTAGPCFHNADTWEVIDQEGRRIASTSGVRRREVGPFLAAAPALYCYAERLRAENATLVAEVERLRDRGAKYAELVQLMEEAAERQEKEIEELREEVELVMQASARLEATEEVLIAELERYRKALLEVDALDPEWQGIENLSLDAAKGLVMRMGEIARTALTGSSQ